jgi:transposase
MRRTVSVSAEQRQELDAVIAHHPKPYVRERAATIRKVADGAVAAQVARTGLFQPRDQDTIYAWLDRYQAEGVSGLLNRPGRGRKPAFSPSARGSGR